MSVLENLLGSAGLGLLQAALGAYCLFFGLGFFGKPPRPGARREPVRVRPLMVVGGVFLIAFGLWLAMREPAR
ncbi:hypothetical protein [Zavarzinella formosa]|uniref:hypothetical protein n=1 Tax=Zavarzinella formosa TaxID=360055 RepID=UPI000301DA16|nr:hypothetical protein [Zavarzinella formosa]